MTYLQNKLIRLVPIAEAAAFLGVTAKTMRRWIHLREIDYVKIGSRYKIKETTIQELIERGSAPPMDWWGTGAKEVSGSHSKLVPIAEAAKRMGVSKSRLQRWAGYRKIEVVRVGGRVLLKEETIQHVIEHGMPSRPWSKS